MRDEDEAAETLICMGTGAPHTDHEYLGDGVYASFDEGGQIWLAVHDHRNIVVALEPGVFARLIQYNDRLMKKYSE